ECGRLESPAGGRTFASWIVATVGCRTERGQEAARRRARFSLGEGHYSRFFERRKSRGRVYSYLSVGHRAVQRPLSSSMNRTVQRNSCGPFLFRSEERRVGKECEIRGA